MTLTQVSQAISEILESGGLRQLEGECAGLEHGHHVILRRALDTMALHGISLLAFFIRTVRLDCDAEFGIVLGNGIFQ
jgi:hypothetical protein